VKKKTSIPQDQVIKKSCDNFDRSGSKRAEPPKFTINTSKVKLSSPHEVFFQFIVYYYEVPEEAQSYSNAVNLAVDLLLSRQARKHRGESAYHQFKITNLRQNHGHQ